MFGIFVGLFSTSILPEYWGGDIQGLSLPTEAFRNTFPTWSMAAALVVVLIPSLGILLSGGSILAKKSLFKPAIGWTMLGLFIFSILTLSFTVPKIIYSFKEDGEYKTEKVFNLNGKMAILKVNEIGLDDYKVTDLTLKGYEGTEFKLVQRFRAQGYTRKNGVENAQMVEYNVQQQDSTLTFDSNLSFKKDAKFRAQRLDMELFIPYGQTFVIEEDLWRIIDNRYEDYDGYHDSNFNKTWKMTERGFECINCTEPTESKTIQLNDQFGYKDFNEIEIAGIFDMVIRKAEEFSVQLDGPDAEKRKYEVSVSGETLEIKYRTRKKNYWDKGFDIDDKVKINITLPSLKKLKIKGAGEFVMRGFEEEAMDISLLGAMTGEAIIDAHNLTLDMAGPMVLELEGHGRLLQAEVTKMSQLKANRYEVEDAVVEAKGMARARVNALHSVEIDTDVISSVKYQGNPEVIKRND